MSQDSEYDYWGNLEHDFGFSAKEMAGIKRAATQWHQSALAKARQTIEAKLLEARIKDTAMWIAHADNTDGSVPVIKLELHLAELTSQLKQKGGV